MAVILGEADGLVGLDLGFEIVAVVILGLVERRRGGGDLRREQRLGGLQRVDLFAAVDAGEGQQRGRFSGPGEERAAAERGRLRAQKADNGTWLSSKNWVDEYQRNKHKRAKKPK